MKIRMPPLRVPNHKARWTPLIRRYLKPPVKGRWIEPFCGSGAIGFNLGIGQALYCDINPHIIRLYREIQNSRIGPAEVQAHLMEAGEALEAGGRAYFNGVRDRFNRQPAPLDFLLLNQASRNGELRFDREGNLDGPFDPQRARFSPARIRRITAQVAFVSLLTRHLNCRFICRDFRETLKRVAPADFLFCDPPDMGWQGDRFGDWRQRDQEELIGLLETVPCRFLLLLSGKTDLPWPPSPAFYIERQKAGKKRFYWLISNYPPPPLPVQTPPLRQRMLFSSSLGY